MTLSPLTAMQEAVDIVNRSPHPTNKIAAALWGEDSAGHAYLMTDINHWPAAIEEKIGTETRLGSSSGTVHAETACILKAPLTLGASLAITDPFCPNCAKNIAEAGIKKIYIDHKGFEKDWGARRADDFLEQSLRIVERAGISVFEVRRKEQKIITLIHPADDYTPPADRPLHRILPKNDEFSGEELKAAAYDFTPLEPSLPFAAGWTTGDHHPPTILIAEPHVTVGYTETSLTDRMEMEHTNMGKYSFIMEPVNRLLMASSRLGVKIDPRMLISSRVPTSREQVNLVAAGLTHLHIMNLNQSRDVAAVSSLRQLTNANILVVDDKNT